MIRGNIAIPDKDPKSPNRRAWAEMCRFLAGSPTKTFLAERQAAWTYRKKLQRERRLARGMSTTSTTDPD